MTEVLALASPCAALAGAGLLGVIPSGRPAAALNYAFALVTGGLGLAAGTWSVYAGGASGWLQLDATGAVFLAVNALVGACSAIASERYLAGNGASILAAGPRWYRACLYLFWAALLALPVVSNLGSAWLLVEATTAASALLVAYSGRRRALEAGWKYLILTTLGLAAALLGLVLLYAAGSGEHSLSSLDWHSLRSSMPAMPRPALVVALTLLVAGFAAKVGWAPVHQWLPDAHSEAPAPVSALLSAALLPSVILVVWRLDQAAGGGAGLNTVNALLIGFGLLSLGLSVPFLWRPLAIKRLLAYSSLEHVGVIAVGIGFGTSIALAGVVLHVAVHAVAKALGFYTTSPLFAVQASAEWRPAAGVARRSRPVAALLAVSLLTLSGLPPSPLFVSELLILAGGFAAGAPVVAAAAAGLLALGFIGLAQQTIEIIFGRPGTQRAHDGSRPSVRAAS